MMEAASPAEHAPPVRYGTALRAPPPEAPSLKAAPSKANGSLERDLERFDDNAKGTVGCVALDASGCLAAATSTGGLCNKLPGRIGDSAVIGAGTWALNSTCAVSATGHGELFIKHNVAGRISTMMEIGGMELQAAADRVVLSELRAGGASGGIVSVDSAGNISMPFNTTGMYRAALHADGSIEVHGFDLSRCRPRGQPGTPPRTPPR